MDAPPSMIRELASSITWPDPRDDGTTVLDTETLRNTRGLLHLLLSYLEVQLDRCKT